MRSDGQLERVTFRKRTDNHAADVWNLIALCPQLDRNSLYCELLLCPDFADTCVLVERAGEVVGWMSACRWPSDPSTVFIWQIAVHRKLRNIRLGKDLIRSALNRPPCEGVTHIKCTVTFPTGRPGCSSQLWLGAWVRQSGKLWFDRKTKERHGSGSTIALKLHRSSFSLQAFPPVCLANTQIRRQR